MEMLNSRFWLQGEQDVAHLNSILEPRAMPLAWVFVDSGVVGWLRLLCLESHLCQRGDQWGTEILNY